MQPIVWLTILGVAGAGLGMGFLAPGFDLTLQGLAAQENKLESPIVSADVDLVVQKIEGLSPDETKVIFKNRITQCSFHSPQSIGTGGAIICKLIDGDGDIVAEGTLDLSNTMYSGSDVTFIDIVQFKVGANDVQNIEKVKIVVLGGDPTLQP